MAGYAGQGVNMKSRLGKPFGVGLDRFRIFMAFGALNVDVPSRDGQQRLYRMGVMAIGAGGIFAMIALGVFAKNRGVTITARCPGWSDPVGGMTFSYL